MRSLKCIQFDIRTNREEIMDGWKDFVNEALPAAATRGLLVEVIQTECASSGYVFFASTKLTHLDL